MLSSFTILPLRSLILWNLFGHNFSAMFWDVMDRSEIADIFCKAISSGNAPALFEDFVSEQTTWAVVFGTDPSNSERHFLGWEEEYKAWCKRDLSAKAYVYWWADGIYLNVRLDEERSCVLVLMVAHADGTKELLAVVDGCRESTQSWRELLQQLKRHGLTVAPKLAIGDGSLGFWLALQEEYGPVRQQRC
jgi:putative transposase